MNENDFELLLKYPLITISIRNGVKHYTGRVMSGNQDLDLHIIEDNANFKLQGHEVDTSATTVSEFLEKIIPILGSNNTRNLPTNHVDIYRKILQEYSEFTTFHLNFKSSRISEDLSRVTITTTDEGARSHILEIRIDSTETKEIFKPLVHLPEKITKDFASSFSNLNEIYSKFLTSVDELQPFFDVMDDLDASCSILDPENPTRRDCYRRIWIDQNLSILVVIDPLDVKSRPELKFLGPERLVDRYLERLTQQLEDWDENENLVQGLLNILELEEFPRKPGNDRELLVDVGECSICFSLRLDDKLPEVICGNKSCENMYHCSCLYEWLTSVNSKRIFNQLHGQCPNCEKAISCPLPDVDIT